LTPLAITSSGSFPDAEHERLADLADLAADGGRGVLRGERAVGVLADLGVDARPRERGRHPFDGVHAAAVGTRRAIS
jgi:hypothetical protein